MSDAEERAIEKLRGPFHAYLGRAECEALLARLDAPYGFYECPDCGTETEEWMETGEYRPRAAPVESREPEPIDYTANVPWDRGTLCPECGPNVDVDEDGCCLTCGGQATGAWLESATLPRGIHRYPAPSERSEAPDAFLVEKWLDAPDDKWIRVGTVPVKGAADELARRAALRYDTAGNAVEPYPVRIVPLYRAAPVDREPAGDGAVGADHDVPRRRQLDKLTPVEQAIDHAVCAVESLPADERLTRAVVLLQEAQEAVADYVDGVTRAPDPEPVEGEYAETDMRKLVEDVLEEHGTCTCDWCGNALEVLARSPTHRETERLREALDRRARAVLAWERSRPRAPEPEGLRDALDLLDGAQGANEALRQYRAGMSADEARVLDRAITALTAAAQARRALDLARKGAEADHITTLALCEQRSLVLRPGLTYRFEPIDGCEACARLLADGALEVEAEAAMNEAHRAHRLKEADDAT